MNRTDLVSQKFGRLTVISATDKRDKRYTYVIWECKCDCGNTVYANTVSLKNKQIQSCGCLRKERQQYSMSLLQNKVNVENTNLLSLSKKDVNKNNTSGARGVSFVKRTKKWSARITFRGERHSLGYFDSIEDAIEARKEAEEKYYKPILDKYKRETS